MRTIANLPITALCGVSDALAGHLADLGILRIFDLVMHLPRAYEDRSRIVPIAEVADGMAVSVVGRIVSVNDRRGLSAVIDDGTGRLELKFFKSYPSLVATMKMGTSISAFGEVRISRFGTQMSHPDYHITGTKTVDNTILPIYPTLKNLHQNKLRQLIRLALTAVTQEGLLSVDLTNTHLKNSDLILVDNQDALLSVLHLIHNPPKNADFFYQTQLLESIKARTHPACRRLILEELIAHQLIFMQRRGHLNHKKAPRCHHSSDLADKLLAQLPFDLTYAQQRVIQEIAKDLASSAPMFRLVQGDVGAGKTLVAAMGACYALDSGWQVAIMAPTEILAEQHFINFGHWFSSLGIKVGFLVGKQNTRQRKQILEDLTTGTVEVVIGTQALFQEGVHFAKLGLVIIDEQHRFGVEQRLRLADKGVAGTTPHQLAMTATPIPRTLAMSVYGDMDISVIDELPKGRTPITTVTINRDRRDEVLERVAKNCKEGKQAYWICPLVEESATLDAQSAQLMHKDIQAMLDISVGLVHGKMKAGEKQAVMANFKAGKIDLLVATTVVEVGVDVPNASLMVIENAERLGLSQLHQLRGRVGRGSVASFCVLLYQMPLSPTGIERLNILRDSTDGFVIAQKDLQLRGAGELLGKRQTGDMGYYIADVVRDEALLDHAQIIAKTLIHNPANTDLINNIITLWLPWDKGFVGA